MDGELTYQAWATNYENELPKLTPCPFCGGKARVYKHFKDPHCQVGCADRRCHVWVGRSPLYDTEAEAVEAWNTRAPMSYEDLKILLDEFGVSERTCRADYRGGGYGIGGWYCSECGGYMHDDMQQDMAYCPNCGRKVDK